ncbi:tungsten ABC transporter TupABC, periplasmic tungstate-binding protein [Campylobacter pinnipediorum subsp. caledonicus]|uniref:Tungsten ABC transporter TupABC, periplasmic tungstate-binding protein n=1 Tax=Campylobacter pinnipediorum subsp. caledonicus TaxID=1874362 RepID=A0A1S6U8U6_9BACT|nr:tungstate ABC transporter substrate-binding protein TupA [Campylobacter pinnipediorum]AQW86467.1 tungsten ABC transporter TupABC, periplasmic tungstate-binding protein [Campylobacter pinnipediorum subsp. caledonicus]AQW88119.1 tungsten ABC transporter TupABC, periplasmic tungstate-binding protein [Campylobacter pinnipediorum subsp. caledonicus]OPA71560.1 tungsten ABC transporter substrate-binding protein [Campylobacter pinnipediorum subsp. caledonicus]
MKKIFISSLIAVCALFGADSDLNMATTTSTDNTGLLDAIYPVYKAKTGVDLKWTAVGTGAALKMGENCDVDILFVHSPKVEMDFINNGYGVERKAVMYNDFVLIADKSIADKFKGKDLKDAFEVINKEKIPFFSRGDKSGTDNKEKGIWKKITNGIPENEAWYRQTGQGMLATIKAAEEQKGASFTDRGTYIKYEANAKGNPDLVIVNEGDESLKNLYSIIAVNPKHCKNADIENANKFINWIISDEGQKFVGDFKLLNKQLFTPDAKTRKN